MAIRALDKKLARDIRRMWAQVLAIALVTAAGVATLILAVGAYQSLAETRSAYYERHRFADVFATAKRAPLRLVRDIQWIKGVAAVDPRVSKPAILDVPGFSPPVTGLVLSVPDHGGGRLNRPYIRSGRMPESGSTREVVVNEAFARAHAFKIGDRFQAILNQKKRRLTIVGLVLSPEHIYAIGPGDLVPDSRRFAVIWMSEKALGEIFDLDGAFNSISVQLLRGAQEARVIEQLDSLLKRYGGTGAIGRADQISHAFLDAELQQLRALARVIPPIFLFVSAFLINMTLTRLITLEREQIGLLKALGYASYTIVWHYMKLVLVIAIFGIIVGFALGTYFGQGLTRLYAEFFHFPFLVFKRDPDVYVIAVVVSAGAAVVGALRAVYAVVTLAPVVAMNPPAPPHYRQLWGEKLWVFRHLSQLTMISLRHILRWPVRAAFTTLGVALGGSLIVVSLFSFDSVEHLIDFSFFVAQRQDATLTLSDEQHIRVLQAIGRLPGVMRVTPFRSVVARIRNGQYEKKISITGKPREPILFRVIDRSLRAVKLPETGLVVDERIAQLLRIKEGDMVSLEILGGWRGAKRLTAGPGGTSGTPDRLHWADGRAGVVHVPVSGIIQSYFGLSAYMSIAAMNAMLGEGYMVSGVHVGYDANQEARLFAAIKSTPRIASIGLRGVSLGKFRETIAKNIHMMVSIYVGLAVVIALGVVYNTARIQLSEQGRELASLRVLGFTRAEVSRILLVELAMLVLAAQPLAWLLGYGFGWLTIQGFSSDLYRVPFTITISTYAWASLVVLATSILAALIVRRRIDRLDLIAVLKTRE